MYNKGKEPYYILTNNFNKRVKVTQRKLLDIVFNSGRPLRPRSEEAIYMGGRNKRFYFDEGIYPKTPEQQRLKMDFSKYVVTD